MNSHQRRKAFRPTRTQFPIGATVVWNSDEQPVEYKCVKDAIAQRTGINTWIVYKYSIQAGRVLIWCRRPDMRAGLPFLAWELTLLEPMQ